MAEAEFDRAKGKAFTQLMVRHLEGAAVSVMLEVGRRVGLFETMSEAFYSMLHRTLREGAPLEITPQQVRQQIAVIEEARRQNPRLYPPDASSP